MSLSSDPDSNPDVHSTSRVVQGWIDRLPTDEVYEIWDRDNSLTYVVVNGIAEVAKTVPVIIPGLIEQLVENSRVRRQVAQALGVIVRERHETADSLVNLLKRQNIAVQIAAISALAEGGTRAVDAVPPLIRFLQQHELDWKLCSTAISALASSGSGSETAYVAVMESAQEESTSDFHYHLIKALKQMSWEGGAAALWLAESLHDPDESVREIAAEVMASRHLAEKFLPQLISVLDDASLHVRRSACSGMAKIASKERTDLVTIFQRALADGDHGVRFQALRGLSNIGPAAKEAFPEGAKILDDPNPIIRRLAIECLKKVMQE